MSLKNRDIQVTKLLLWCMAIFYFGVISWFSGMTASQSSGESGYLLEKIISLLTGLNRNEIGEKIFYVLHKTIRKLAHFANFFILGFIYGMLASEYEKRRIIKALKISLLCGLIASFIDEGHQYFVQGRSAELRDVCVDFAGVYTGCVVFVFLRRVFKC